MASVPGAARILIVEDDKKTAELVAAITNKKSAVKVQLADQLLSVLDSIP